MKHIYFFVGTAAEYIKLAPIIKEFKRRRIKFKLITSGQNNINFDELEGFTGKVKVDISLKHKSVKSSILGFIIWTMRTFVDGFISLGKEFKRLNKENSYFIIHGDTISSLVGAFIAKLYGLKIVHIESGLRSYNFLEPIPEEICRFIIIHLANILFAPNEWALSNLKNIRAEKISTGHNTLLECCLWAAKRNTNDNSIGKFGKYYILFIHRQEHIYFNKEWTRNTIELIINNANKDLTCLFLLHSLTSRFLEYERIDALTHKQKKLVLLPRQSYKDNMNLLKNAQFIATDSCTNQEEAFFLGVPMLALRNLTERTEGLQKNVVISKCNTKIVKNFLRNYKRYKTTPVRGVHRPSKVVVDYLLL